MKDINSVQPKTACKMKSKMDIPRLTTTVIDKTKENLTSDNVIGIPPSIIENKGCPSLTAAVGSRLENSTGETLKTDKVVEVDQKMEVCIINEPLKTPADSVIPDTKVPEINPCPTMDKNRDKGDKTLSPSKSERQFLETTTTDTAEENSKNGVIQACMIDETSKIPPVTEGPTNLENCAENSANLESIEDILDGGAYFILLPFARKACSAAISNIHNLTHHRMPTGNSEDLETRELICVPYAAQPSECADVSEKHIVKKVTNEDSNFSSSDEKTEDLKEATVSINNIKSCILEQFDNHDEDNLSKSEDIEANSADDSVAKCYNNVEIGSGYIKQSIPIKIGKNTDRKEARSTLIVKGNKEEVKRSENTSNLSKVDKCDSAIPLKLETFNEFQEANDSLMASQSDILVNGDFLIGKSELNERILTYFEEKNQVNENQLLAFQENTTDLLKVESNLHNCEKTEIICREVTDEQEVTTLNDPNAILPRETETKESFGESKNLNQRVCISKDSAKLITISPGSQKNETDNLYVPTVSTKSVDDRNINLYEETPNSRDFKCSNGLLKKDVENKIAEKQKKTDEMVEIKAKNSAQSPLSSIESLNKSCPVSETEYEVDFQVEGGKVSNTSWELYVESVIPVSSNLESELERVIISTNVNFKELSSEPETLSETSYMDEFQKRTCGGEESITNEAHNADDDVHNTPDMEDDFPNNYCAETGVSSLKESNTAKTIPKPSDLSSDEEIMSLIPIPAENICTSIREKWEKIYAPVEKEPTKLAGDKADDLKCKTVISGDLVASDDLVSTKLTEVNEKCGYLKTLFLPNKMAPFCVCDDAVQLVTTESLNAVPPEESAIESITETIVKEPDLSEQFVDAPGDKKVENKLQVASCNHNIPSFNGKEFFGNSSVLIIDQIEENKYSNIRKQKGTQMAESKGKIQSIPIECQQTKASSEERVKGLAQKTTISNPFIDPSDTKSNETESYITSENQRMGMLNEVRYITLLDTSKIETNLSETTREIFKDNEYYNEIEYKVSEKCDFIQMDVNPNLLGEIVQPTEWEKSAVIMGIFAAEQNDETSGEISGKVMSNIINVEAISSETAVESTSNELENLELSSCEEVSQQVPRESLTETDLSLFENFKEYVFDQIHIELHSSELLETLESETEVTETISKKDSSVSLVPQSTEAEMKWSEVVPTLSEESLESSDLNKAEISTTSMWDSPSACPRVEIIRAYIPCYKTYYKPMSNQYLMLPTYYCRPLLPFFNPTYLQNRIIIHYGLKVFDTSRRVSKKKKKFQKKHSSRFQRTPSKRFTRQSSNKKKCQKMIH